MHGDSSALQVNYSLACKHLLPQTPYEASEDRERTLADHHMVNQEILAWFSCPFVILADFWMFSCAKLYLRESERTGRSRNIGPPHLLNGGQLGKTGEETSKCGLPRFHSSQNRLAVVPLPGYSKPRTKEQWQTIISIEAL